MHKFTFFLNVNILILKVFFFCTQWGYSQEYISVHQEQDNYYKQYPLVDTTSHEEKGFATINDKDCILNKVVFGYEPYWGSTNYYNYHWNLISDMCYFSYETDPSTGYPTDTHNWMTRNVIDTALAHGVNVHLCVTLFSNHMTFFTSPDAQQNLIYNIITLLAARGGSGVNIDFEAMPTSASILFTPFIANLKSQMDIQLPGKILSIAVPSVNWSNIFDISGLIPYVDYFMIMGYDYYWNGSSQAGPVAGIYSMTNAYDYNVSRSISYYLSQGVEPEKIILGLPYYGRMWPTQNPLAPSDVSGYGEVLTYEYTRNNSSGNFSLENKKFEPASQSNYFSFNDSGWYQCFIEDTISLGRKYDLINRMNLAGLGIWALGYDGPYSDLWSLISQKLSDCSVVVSCDTIYDSGGPSWNHYNNENFLYNLSVNEGHVIYLEFLELGLESGNDSLWVIDGTPENGQLIEALSGLELPSPIVSTGNTITLHFYSDGSSNLSGWKAYYKEELSSSSMNILMDHEINLKIFPNPCSGFAKAKFYLENQGYIEIICYNLLGGKICNLYHGETSQGENLLSLNNQSLQQLKSGIYMIKLIWGGNILSQTQLIKLQ